MAPTRGDSDVKEVGFHAADGRSASSDIAPSLPVMPHAAVCKTLPLKHPDFGTEPTLSDDANILGNRYQVREWGQRVAVRIETACSRRRRESTSEAEAGEAASSWRDCR